MTLGGVATVTQEEKPNQSDSGGDIKMTWNEILKIQTDQDESLLSSKLSK